MDTMPTHVETLLGLPRERPCALLFLWLHRQSCSLWRTVKAEILQTGAWDIVMDDMEGLRRGRICTDLLPFEDTVGPPHFILHQLIIDNDLA